MASGSWKAKVVLSTLSFSKQWPWANPREQCLPPCSTVVLSWSYDPYRHLRQVAAELVQFRHLIVIPSWRFTCRAPHHVALQAQHSTPGPTGGELNEACSSGTTTVCSCLPMAGAQCPNLSSPEECRAAPVPRPLCCPQALGWPKGEVNTFKISHLSDLSLCLTWSWEGRSFPFPLFSLLSTPHFALALQQVALGSHHNWAWTIDSGCRQ